MTGSRRYLSKPESLGFVQVSFQRKGSLSFAPIQSVNERILNGGGDDHMVSERIRSDALFPDSDAGWNFLERSTNRANFSVSLKIRSAVKQAAISFVTRVIAPVSPK